MKTRNNTMRPRWAGQELLAEIDWLDGSLEEKAKRLGISLYGIEQAARRHNRPDIANEVSQRLRVQERYKRAVA